MPGTEHSDIEQRINSLDIIRGIALLGILLLNITSFGLPFSYYKPGVIGGQTGANLVVWIINNIFFEGTMRGLFTILFGAGFYILITKESQKCSDLDRAKLHFKRMFWLLIFGLFHSYILLSSGEILYPYAICGIFLFFFRKVSPKKLIFLGLIILGIGNYNFIHDYHHFKMVQLKGLEAKEILENGYTLTPNQQNDLSAWQLLNSPKTPQQINNMIQIVRNRCYFELFKLRKPITQKYHTSRIYKTLIWDILSFMLFGIALFKIRFFQAQKKFSFYIIVALLGYVIGLSINIFETNLLLTNNFSAIAFSRSLSSYHIGRLFTTVGHLGLLLVFVKLNIFNKFKNALANVGKMSLSNYLGQTVLGNFLFWGLGLGLGLFARLQRYELYYIVLIIWAIQIIFSNLWLKYFNYGPLEWLWKILTFGQLFPLKK